MELLGLRWVGTPVGGLLLLLASTGLVHGDCVFGPNNTDYLVLRNNTILSLMNDTLRNYTVFGNQAIASVSNFNLINYIRNYPLTAANYLEFVSLGKMLTIDWLTVTSKAMTNETSGSRTVATFITTVFVNPLHHELQRMASYYSFSYGIFRPAQKQFNFTGFTPATNSGENSTLDLGCTAGSSFLWRLSTYVAYNAYFSNQQSPQFAKMATVVEQAFDQYYRRNTATNKDYIRSNVIDGFESYNSLILFMEVYFLNATLQSADIGRLMTLSQVPAIRYTDPLNSNDATVVSFRSESSYTYVVNASYAPSTTTRLSTTSSSSTRLTTYPTATATPLGANSTPPLAISSTNPTNPAFSQPPSQSPAIQSNWTSTNGYSNNATLTSGTTANLSTSISSAGSFSTGSASLQAQTTVLPQTTSNTPAISVTSSSLSSLASSETSPNPETSTTASNNFSVSTGSAIWTALTTSVTSAQLTDQFSSTGTANAASTANLTQTYNPLTNTTTTMANVTQPPSSFPVSVNNSTLATNPTPPNQSTGTQSASSRNVNVGTTFDPDSFFQAEVPVITKVYNDDYLLRKMGTMSPLTERAAFIAVTLPAATGLIIAIIGCMLCWQWECSYMRQKSKI